MIYSVAKGKDTMRLVTKVIIELRNAVVDSAGAWSQ